MATEMVNFWASFIYPIVLMFLWLYFYLFIYLYLCLIFHVILRYISQYCFRLCSSSFSFRSINCLETIFYSIVFSHLWLFPLNYWSNHDYSLVMLCYVLFLFFCFGYTFITFYHNLYPIWQQNNHVLYDQLCQ